MTSKKIFGIISIIMISIFMVSISVYFLYTAFSSEVTINQNADWYVSILSAIIGGIIGFWIREATSNDSKKEEI